MRTLRFMVTVMKMKVMKMKIEINLDYMVSDQKIRRVEFDFPDKCNLIVGESGTGKSYLVELLRDIASLDSSSVLQANPKEVKDFIDSYGLIDNTYAITASVDGLLQSLSTDLFLFIDDAYDTIKRILTRSNAVDRYDEVISAITTREAPTLLIDKGVPYKMFIPDSRIYNFVFKDGVAKFLPILEDGIYGLKKNNYKL